MASTTRWIIDVAYATCGFTASDFNSLATGSVVVAASAITNSSNLDMLADVSFVVTMGGTTTAASRFDVYLLPLNQDGSTYGDGVATGSTAPVFTYYVGSMGVKSGVTSGNTVTGTLRAVPLPPGDFKWALLNNTTVALNATASITAKYRAYNENLNA